MSASAYFRRATITALATCTLPASAAVAQDFRGIQPLEWTFRDHTTILVYGQINEGVLVFDDGEESTSYGLVGNANSSNRLGITSNTTYDSGWDMFSNIEFEYVPHRSSTVVQTDRYAADYGFDKTNFRKIEIALSSDRYGKFWFGQGSMASDGSAEVDYSSTGVIAYSAVGDIGGGLFRFDDETLSGISTGSAYNNYDGLSRKMRVRYDTPSFAGFTLKTSYGQDVLNDEDASLYDVAATYEREYDTIKVGAALAYAHNDQNDADIVSGSVSGLHAPTGLSLTFAGASHDTDRNASYGYAKLGLERKFFPIGFTAFSIDYYSGKDITIEGSDSSSYAFAMVQNVENWNSQWYVGIRQFSYDDENGEYQDGLSTMAGLRVKF